jgi:hypothetical protein
MLAHRGVHWSMMRGSQHEKLEAVEARIPWPTMGVSPKMTASG